MSQSATAHSIPCLLTEAQWVTITLLIDILFEHHVAGRIQGTTVSGNQYSKRRSVSCYSVYYTYITKYRSQTAGHWVTRTSNKYIIFTLQRAVI
jgi:hypothetical protein